MTRRWIWLANVALVSAGLAACSSVAPAPDTRSVWRTETSRSGDAPASPRVVTSTSRIPKGGGIYKVGTPYQVDGQWYEPREEPDYDRTGIASWYGDDFHGRRTANSEIYDMTALSAAHPTLPMPSYAYVTNLANNRTVMVRVNDRGPYARGRIIDLSSAAADALGMISHGTAQVRVRYAGRAPLDGNDWREQRYLASQPWMSRNRAVAAAEPDVGPRLPTPRPITDGWSVDAFRANGRSGLGAR
jgi:rare lipoprotein A